MAITRFRAIGADPLEVDFLYNQSGGAVEFRWNSWNEEHLERHGVAPDEAEEVVLAAKPPFPLAQDDEKYLVWGQTEAGRLVQVVFVIDADDGSS